jgi:hypothetical protein
MPLGNSSGETIMTTELVLSTKPRSRLRLILGIVAMASVLALSGWFLFWLFSPTRVSATALFQVSRVRPSILKDEERQRRDIENFPIVQRTQLAYLSSHYVLQAVVRNPGIAALSILQPAEDPVKWLQENLKVEFLKEGEILSISLEGPEEQSEELKLIVDAVAKAYTDEVLYKIAQENLVVQDVKVKIASKLAEQIDRKLRESEASDATSDVKTIDIKATPDWSDITLQRIDLSILIETYRDVRRSLEHDEIEAKAPSSIKQVQQAVVGPVE